MRRETLRCVAAALALTAAFAADDARAVTYAAVPEPFAWTDSASHTTVLWTGAPGGPAAACTGGSSPVDDDVSDLLPIGFTFSFGGVSYTQVRVMSNGRVQFNNTHCNYGTATTGTPPTYPDPYPAANLARTIRVYGADLEPSLGGWVRWASIGTAPSRQFVVTWMNVQEWNRSGSRFQLQIVLNEDGSFVLRYGALVNPSGGKPDIGWEVDTSDYEKRSYANSAALVNSAQRYYVPGPAADYRFDEAAWTGVAGQILDSSGNAHAGTSLGSAASTASGRICRGGSFPANTTASAIAAAETHVTPGTTGTLTFWARIDSAWNGGTGRVLVDASRNGGTASGADRAFQILKDGSGRVAFVLSDAAGAVLTARSSAFSHASGQWHHVAVTWSMSAGRMDVYVNGVSVATRRGAAIAVPALATIWAGDAHDAVSVSGLEAGSTGGALDELRVYAYEGTRALVLRDMNASHDCTGVASFRISHDRSAIQCAAEPMSVTARASDGSTVSGYQGSVTLATQTGRGTWSSDAGNAGAFSDGAADDGVATYTFSASDGGVARFWLTYLPSATALDVDVWETAAPSVRDDDTEGTLAFGPSGFVVTPAPLPNPPSGAIDTNIPAQTAGVALPLHLTAYGQDASNKECGVIESYAGDRKLSVWARGLDPATLASAVLVDGTPVGASAASATSVSVTFTAGQASVVVRHDDVGRVELSFLDPSVSEPPGGILGTSSGFVVRPATFAITAITRVDGSANPGATTPGGGVFVGAGIPFAVTVEARNAFGSRTPSYGREVVPEGVQAHSSALLAPAGGRNGSSDTGALADGAAFAAITPAGTFRNTQLSFDEVGAITLAARVADGSYLGAGDVVGASSGAVGRFTPQHLEVEVDPVAFATGCQAGGFTYLGQPFAFAPGLHPQIRVEAHSAASTPTMNYTGDWFRLSPATITPRTWSAAHGTLDSAGPNAPTVTDLGAGSGTVAFDQGPELAFVRDVPEAAFAAEIGLSVAIVDADGVGHVGNPLLIGQPQAGLGIAFQDGNEMRFGRLAFENAYGPELRDLAVPLRAEVFDGLRFVPHADDVCTEIPANLVSLAPSPPSLATAAAVAHAPFVGGEAGLTLAAPGAGHTGSVVLGVDLSPAGADLSFLQFDWNGDGNALDDPSSVANFGIYKGSDAVVDVRERY